MGFTDVKHLVLACLDAGAFAFAIREHMSEKNLLATGAVTVEQVRRMIGRCTGLQYRALPMTEDPDTLKHELRPVIDGRQWFIRLKWAGNEVRGAVGRRGIPPASVGNPRNTSGIAAVSALSDGRPDDLCATPTSFPAH